MTRKGSHWPTVAMIGAFPPPFGGISVHSQRLVSFLNRHGVDCILYNVRSEAENPPHVVSRRRFRSIWVAWFCLFHKSPVVHMQLSSWPMRLLFGITAALRRGKYVQSIQGRSISASLAHRSWLRRALTRWILRKTDFVIASNPDIYAECVERAGMDSAKLAIVPAFIAPQEEDIEELPAEIQAYLNTHEPILSAAGSIGEVLDGADLYGIDMMIELVERLKRDYPRVGLVLSVNGGDEMKIRQTLGQCQERVGEAMLLITEALPDISRILEKSNLFVRPTNTDGDSVSIREALYFGTPVVASDVVPRPEPVISFRTRDSDDFEEKVRGVLTNLKTMRARVLAASQPDNAEKIVSIYAALLRNN